jgi:FMN phosphatase YigB (HAD superfamily)
MMLHQPDFPKETFAHTVPTLRELKLAGKLIGIVSATTMAIMKQDAEWAGLPLNMLDYVQTAESTEYHKPDARVFEPALEWAISQRVAADEILYVGDGLQDLKAARGAGMNFLGVQTGLVTAEDFAAHEGLSIADLSHLLKKQAQA